MSSVYLSVTKGHGIARGLAANLARDTNPSPHIEFSYIVLSRAQTGM